MKKVSETDLFEKFFRNEEIGADLVLRSQLLDEVPHFVIRQLVAGHVEGVL